MVKSITALAAAAVFAYNVVASPAPTATTFPIQSGKNDWDGYNKDAQTSFSIPTAASAAPTAAGIAIEGGNNYVNYSTVGGLFLQDLNTTDPSTFNYVCTSPSKSDLALILDSLPPTSVSSTNPTQARPVSTSLA